MIDKFNNGHSSFPEIERLTQKRIFFGKFHFTEFYLLTVPYHVGKFENNS